MTEFELLLDLHLPAERQGPGGDTETKLALQLAGLMSDGPGSSESAVSVRNDSGAGAKGDTRALKIADIGCGTGASTMILAEQLNAEITAVDFLPEFLQELEKRAKARKVEHKIRTLESSMDALPFQEKEFDMIWSEGAIYNMGFEAGISAWKSFLKPGGKLVVSEITWFGENRPEELDRHWKSEYPEIAVASAKFQALERNGFRPLGYFTLPESCWLDNYYGPMEKRFDAFLEKHDRSEDALAIVEAERNEISLYRKYSEHFGYGVYIAQKI